MDVNGSRFHLMNTEVEWQSAVQRSDELLKVMDTQTEDNNVAWDQEHQRVALQSQLFRFPDRSEQRLKNTDYRGAAQDRYGNNYWIGKDRQSLYFLPAQASSAGVYWTVDDHQQQCLSLSDTVADQGSFHAVRTDQEVLKPLPSLSGLAITGDHYMIVGTHQPGGLFIFDLHAGGVPMWLQWPSQTEFYPRDISVGAGGGIRVLDVREDSQNARVWCLDQYFRVTAKIAETGSEVADSVSLIFRPENEKTADTIENITKDRYHSLSSISRELALQTDINNVIAIECMVDGSWLLLESPLDLASTAVLHRYYHGDKTHSVSLSSHVTEDKPLQAHDFTFVAKRTSAATTTVADFSGVIYVSDRTGNQTFAYQLDFSDQVLSLQLLAHYYPMHAYSGTALTITSEGRVSYETHQRWLSLVAKPQRRYDSMGKLHGIILDSEKTACEWHRLILDACIPDDTGIRVWTRAADKREWLSNQDFSKEPSLHFREYGSEMPTKLPRSSQQKAKKGDDKTGSWELLLQSAIGRYLEIRLDFYGNGRSSPLLKAMRIYYPRFSYLKEYLPAVYQDDASSAHFLNRYLANVEGLFTEMEGHIAHIDYLFDSRTTPPEFLEWLASWLGVIFNPEWNDSRRRLFIRFVPLLYRWRGTPIGLRAAIGIAISPCPNEDIFAELGWAEANKNPQDIKVSNTGQDIRIIERFDLRRFSARALGVPDNEDTPILVAIDGNWSPAQGVAQLHERYKEYLQELIPAANDQFPPTLPGDPEQAAAWRYFLQHHLDFHYVAVDACNPQDSQYYREFLARRYHSVQAYQKKYGLAGNATSTSFQSIYLPNTMPSSGVALNDWIEFVSGYMAIKRNAHQFTVLIPAYIDESPALRQQRLQKTKAVVTQEKPAHTNFDVSLYWALFRVGSARLGLDSIMGEGSRYVAMVLNHEYLGQSYLAAAHPTDIKDRYVTGRDRLQEV